MKSFIIRSLYGKQMFRHRLIVLFLLGVSWSAFSQRTEIVFSKSIMGSKSITIDLCDSVGITPVNAQIFNLSNRIFFLIKPAAGQVWKFSAKDVETKVLDLKFIQNTKVISIYKTESIFDNIDISAVIISFQKSQVDLTKPFKFTNKNLESTDLSITEKMWPNYYDYLDNIKSARVAITSQNYSSAFRSFSEVWRIAPNSSYLPSFSFYASTKDSLIRLTDLVISQSSSKMTKEIEAFKSDASVENLAKTIMLKNSLLQDISYVDSFYKANTPEFDVKAKAASLANVKLTIKSESQKAEDFFMKKTLSLFEDKNYQDYQYKIYSEVLAKLITSVDKISSISSFDSIPFSQLKKYPILVKEMNDMGWTQNFANICMLLNKNIKTNGFLFNEAALSNYNRNKSTETQPYSYLFKAFNALMKKDKALFVELINQCMSTITDKELLSNLDLYVSLVNNASNSNAAFWELLQNGYVDQNSGSLQEAKSNYEKAEKLVNTNEVLYFLLASVNLKLGDRYGAEIYFKRANTINTRFILPKLFQIDNMIDDKDYETALLNANEAIAINPIWYFYFRKANLLFLTNKFDESRMILLNNCVTINPLDYDQYLLLGDVYSSLSDAKNARDSYMKAGNIKPNDIAYKRKMELLKLNQAFKNPPAK